MPPRPPPPPSVLVVLCVLGALVAAWVAIAVEQAGRSLMALPAGVPVSGLSVRSIPPYTLGTDVGTWPPLAPWTVAAILLGGSVVLVAAALGTHGLVRLFRSPGWLRGLTLELTVLALLWWPTVLFAGAFPDGGGPVADLYDRLGEPQAGRWASGALGLVVLTLLSPVVSAWTVRTGRSWMRADALEFRRRLVRVVSGYPSVVALGSLLVVNAWVPPLAAVGWAALVLGMVNVKTR